MSDEQHPASAETNRPDSPRANRRLTRRVVAFGVAAAILLAGGVGVAFAVHEANKPAPIAEGKSTPTTVPLKVLSFPLAREALFRGEVASWTLHSGPEIAAVLPATGSAQSGQVALSVDAPAPSAPTIAASALANVTPESTYSFTAWVRVQSEHLTLTPGTFLVGDTVIPLPDSAASWQEVSATVEIPAGVTSIDIALRIEGPVSGLSIDQVSLATDGGANVVPNPSFEDVVPTAAIANDTLVMPTATAVIAAAVPEGEVRWEVISEAGEPTASGAVESTLPITPISLPSLSQGYHSVNVIDSAGQTYSFPVALIDTPGSKIALDERFGVTAQFKRDWHVGGARLAAALGFGDLRGEANWKWNETTRGQYDWDPTLVKEFGSVHAHGLKSTGIIVYVNKFYDDGIMPTSAEGLAAYGRYGAAATQTFGFDAVEIYNEPNHEKFNKSDCGLGPTCYIPLIDAVRGQLAREDQGIPVIGGGIALYDSDWFDGFWQAGAMDRIDIVSYHPYEGWIERNPELMRPTVAESISDMQQHTGVTKPVWITEMGFTTMVGGVSDEQQRDWLIRSQTLALATGADKFFWYDIVDDSPDAASGEGNFGLYEHAPRQGVAVVAPKPAAFGQALLVAQVAGRAGPTDESDETHNIIRFGQDSDALRVAWAVGGASEWRFASDVAVQVVTSSGVLSVVEPLQGYVSVPLSDQPSFVSFVND